MLEVSFAEMVAEEKTPSEGTTQQDYDPDGGQKPKPADTNA